MLLQIINKFVTRTAAKAHVCQAKEVSPSPFPSLPTFHCLCQNFFYLQLYKLSFPTTLLILDLSCERPVLFQECSIVGICPSAVCRRVSAALSAGLVTDSVATLALGKSNNDFGNPQRLCFHHQPKNSNGGEGGELRFRGLRFVEVEVGVTWKVRR